MVVDYKTNRPAAAALKDVPAAYLRQLAAYRDLVVPGLSGQKGFHFYFMDGYGEFDAGGIKFIFCIIPL